MKKLFLILLTFILLSISGIGVYSNNEFCTGPSTPYDCCTDDGEGTCGQIILK